MLLLLLLLFVIWDVAEEGCYCYYYLLIGVCWKRIVTIIIIICYLGCGGRGLLLLLLFVIWGVAEEGYYFYYLLFGVWWKRVVITIIICYLIRICVSDTMRVVY